MTAVNKIRRVVLITGAFSGIGEATALRFAREHWVVYASGRNLSKSEPLKRSAENRGFEIQIVEMDVTSLSAVKSVLDRIENEHGRLDVIVNNAGYGLMGAVLEASSPQIRHQFDVNAFSPVEIAREALGLMKRGSRGRIINVSSALGRFVFPGTGVYAASKHALEALSDALRMELKIFGPDFHVILIEPGLIHTAFGENTKTAETEIPSSPYKNSLVRAQAKFTKRKYLGAPPESVAQVIYRAAVTPWPRARYTVTVGARIILICERIFPTSLMDYFKSAMAGLRR